MPAWDMPDRQIWQLVAYIRHLPSPARLAAAEPPENDREAPVTSATYVGSATCKKCHEEIYTRWSKSRMANVVRDPREHPDAIIPDLSKPDPLLTFGKDDIAFVYGTAGSSAISPRSATIIFRSRRNGTSRTRSGRSISSATVPTGGRHFIRRTISSARPARSATAAIRSTTTLPPRR
jgi:hypothetical protein